MGVKRSGMTSGMKPTILQMLHNYFRAKKRNILLLGLSYVFFRMFFVYFRPIQTFTDMLHVHCGANQLKFGFILLSILIGSLKQGVVERSN